LIMSDQNNTVLLRVQLDDAGTQKQIQSLVLAIEATRKAQAELTKARQQGTVSEEQYAKQSVDLKLKLKGQQQEQDALVKNLIHYRAMMGSATNSVDQLKAKSALLTMQYNSLSEAERTTTEAGKILTAELEATNAALLDAGKKVGDNRRGVGAYKEAILGAAKESGLFGGVTEKLSGFQEKYAAAQKIVAVVTGETTGATKALRVAFLAVPLFAIIGLLATLYTFLTSTQKGMDLVERKTAAVGAVFNVLLKIVQPVGAAMVRLFTEPKEAATDLVEFLETNVANRFKAFGVLVDAIRNRDTGKLRDGFIQLTTGIADGTAKAKAFVAELGNAATAQEKLTATTQKIRAAEEALSLEREQSRAKIEELKKLSDDSTKSVAVRTVAAKEAAAIENALLARQLELQQQKINTLAAEQKLKGNITNEDKKALNDLRREQATTTQESLALQTELQNKINSLATEGAAAIEAARKAVDEALLKRIEADIAAGASREAAAAKYLDDQLKGDQLRLASAQKLIDDTKTAEATAYAQDAALLDRALETRRLAIEKSYIEGKSSKVEFEKEMRTIEASSLAARLMLATVHKQQTQQIAREIANFEIKENDRVREEQRKIADAKQQITDATLQTALTASQLVIASIDEESAAGQAALAIKKVLAVAEIGINLEKQIAANAEAGAKISASAPPVTIPLGITYTIATDALAIAGAALSTAKILGFRDGGVLNGPAHQQGGIPFTVAGRTGFEAEGGEVILTKGVWSNPLLRPVASALNVLGGGRPLIPASYMGASGLASPLVREQLRGNVTVPIDYNRLATAFAKMSLSVSVRDTKAAAARDAFTQSQANS
jgi:hypothetical protein